MNVLAARLHEHDSPPVVEEVPLASGGGLVVDMAFAGVNPVDRYQILGRVAGDLPLPRTLGSEGSGTVAEGQERAGERVVLNRSALFDRTEGLWATRVVADPKKVVSVPDGVELEVAASMPVAGATAWRCVHELAATTSDDRVLVLGASGGVGSIIVSLASRLGCEVVGQTGSESKIDFVTERGANRVVVSDAEGLKGELSTFGPTVVFDPLGDGFTAAALELLEPHGRLVIYGTSAAAEGVISLQNLYRKGLRVEGYGGLIEPEEKIRRAVREGLGACARGEFEIAIGSVVRLDDLATALSDLGERRVLGKVVLDLRR